MINYNDVRHLHLEPSSLCNARCPLCPRNHYGVNREDLGYTEHNMTLIEFKQIFTDAFIKQLREINCNGNFGDPCMNPELIDIFRYARSINPLIVLSICTNGGMRTKEFWAELGAMKVDIIFSIDGLEDTNHLYRQDVNWNILMRNLDAYIEAGGRPNWKMIVFDHNRHQVEQVKALAISKGVLDFTFWDSGETPHGRNSGPVYQRDGQLSHVIGKWTGPTEYNVHEDNFRRLLKDPVPHKLVEFDPDSIEIECFTKKNSSIYVTSTGLVFPCCFLGNATESFGRPYMTNLEQVYQLIKDHNALEHGLQATMAWFTRVEPKWQGKESKERLFMCDSNCGKVWVNDRNLAQTNKSVVA